MKKLLQFLPLFVCAATAASAQVLMLDFGATATATSTNSPYHAANGTFTGSSWNQVVNSDATSLVFADGTAATGITVDVGASTSAGTLSVISLTKNPSGSSALGGTINTGVYGDGLVGRDGIFDTTSNTGGTNRGSVGIQVTGLAAGTYDIYVSGRNTSLSTGGTRQETITAYVGVSAVGTSFDFTGYDFGVNSFSDLTSFTSAWVQGENYTKLSVTISSGQAINIATSGAGSTGGGATIDQRGFLNSVQIVAAPIPEPSASALLAGMVVMLVVLPARRRSAGRS